MIYFILAIIVVVLFIIIRAASRTGQYYRVINSKGIPMNTGSYSECASWIKEQREFDNTFGTPDTYKIEKFL